MTVAYTKKCITFSAYVKYFIENSTPRQAQFTCVDHARLDREARCIFVDHFRLDREAQRIFVDHFRLDR